MRDPAAPTTAVERVAIEAIIDRGGFARARRGFEPAEVNLVMGRMAERSHSLAARVEALEAELVAMERATIPPPVVSNPTLAGPAFADPTFKPANVLPSAPSALTRTAARQPRQVDLRRSSLMARTSTYVPPEFAPSATPLPRRRPAGSVDLTEVVDVTDSKERSTSSNS